MLFKSETCVLYATLEMVHKFSERHEIKPRANIKWNIEENWVKKYHCKVHPFYFILKFVVLSSALVEYWIVFHVIAVLWLCLLQEISSGKNQILTMRAESSYSQLSILQKCKITITKLRNPKLILFYIAFIFMHLPDAFI